MGGPTTFLDGRVTLHGGDCLAVLKTLPDASVHAVVTDPPYHLTSITKRFGANGAAKAKSGKTGAYARAASGFMGKQWDGGDIAFRPEVWAECWRVLKPGGWILAFASTRGFGRMSVAIEEAGFITHPLIAELTALVGFDDFLAMLAPEQAAAFWRMVADADPGGMVAWAFGSGFPKAHDAAKAIDKHLGAKGTIVPAGDPVRRIRPGADQDKDGSWEKLAPGSRPGASDTYQPGQYVPATDEAVRWDGFAYGGQALKPAIEPIYMGQKPFDQKNGAANILAHGAGALNIDGCRVGTTAGDEPLKWSEPRGGIWETDSQAQAQAQAQALGRWPANLIHDGSDEVAAAFPETKSGELLPHHRKAGEGLAGTGTFAMRDRTGEPAAVFGDSGSAARFFYSAKADADDRIGSKHPTVKPVDLMRYLVRLVTPPGGIVLDPFAGTGTTGEAAWREGLSAVLIEREAEYRADIAERMRLCLAGPDERKREIAKRRGDVTDDAGPLFGGSAEPVAGGGHGVKSTATSRMRGRRIGPIGLAGSVRETDE